MTIESVMARLRSIADRFEPQRGDEQPPRFDPPATARQIAGLERRSGPIPDDLRAFLLTSAQVVAMDIRNGYWLGGRVTLDPRPDDRWFGLGAPPVIAVATDGGGNSFLLSPARDAVWFWDHETGQTRPVADSFTAFLSRVADDWEHDAADAPDWKYLV